MEIKEQIPLKLCFFWLFNQLKSIIKSLYHGITTTYKTQLTNQRTSIHAIILEFRIYVLSFCLYPSWYLWNRVILLVSNSSTISSVPWFCPSWLISLKPCNSYGVKLYTISSVPWGISLQINSPYLLVLFLKPIGKLKHKWQWTLF